MGTVFITFGTASQRPLITTTRDSADMLKPDVWRRAE